jgi:serine/threonine protein kinase
MQKNLEVKYRILGLVGRGQFGRVFCARDRLNNNQLVALKELDQRRFPTNQFLRELRFLMTLQHPNIVSCISLDYSQNRRYLVMEYCEAGTLRSLVGNLTDNRSWQAKNTGRSLDSNQYFDQYVDEQSDRTFNRNLLEYLDLIIEILEGLKYAHSLNIVHCDIKPENILLKFTKTGWQAKISDFGIAKLGQENEKSDTTGSPGYMAPERFYGQFSLASDLYAVGIILYELLIKQRPFSGNPSDLMFAHLNQRVSIPGYIPKILKDFLFKALEKLPSRRFSSAEEMQLQLKLIRNSGIVEDLLISQDSLSLSRNLSSNLVNGLSELPNQIIEKYLSELIVAFGVFDSSLNNSSFYYATNLTVAKQNLAIDNIQDVDNSATSLYKFDAEDNIKIVDLIITKNQVFVITTNSIVTIDRKSSNRRVLYNSIQKFHWAIANQWLGIITEGNNLEIYYLSGTYFPKILKLSPHSVIALLKISTRHLAVVSNIGTNSHILIISRRGSIMANFDLPVSVTQAIASFEVGRMLLVTELNYLLLVDYKPFRINRLELGYQPQLIKATSWGYIISRNLEQAKTRLQFMDSQGNEVGYFDVDGLVEAIACINQNILVISIKILANSGCKLMILDLRHLNLDLVF